MNMSKTASNDFISVSQQYISCSETSLLVTLFLFILFHDIQTEAFILCEHCLFLRPLSYVCICSFVSLFPILKWIHWAHRQFIIQMNHAKSSLMFGVKNSEIIKTDTRERSTSCPMAVRVGRTTIILFLLIYAADILIFCPHLHATSTSFALNSASYALRMK